MNIVTRQFFQSAFHKRHQNNGRLNDNRFSMRSNNFSTYSKSVKITSFNQTKQFTFNPSITLKKAFYCSKNEAKVENLSILWGSQTGTAKSFAEDLHHQILDRKILDKTNAKIFDLGDYQNEKLTDEKLVIFLTSCYGEGEPTDNARNFFTWLMEEQRAEEKEKFKNVKFTIFGLGSSKAHRERYQVVARYLDERMTELGAQKFYNTGEGDDSEDIESDFENWKGKLLEKLEKSVVKPTEAADQDESAPEKEYSILYFDKNTEVSQIRFFDPKVEAGVNNLFPATLIDSIDVCPKSTRTTKNIWFSIQGSNIEYKAGDYVCVLPKNSEFNIQRAAQRLNVNLDAKFSIIEKNPDALPLSLTRFKDKTFTVRQVLEEYVDLQNFVAPTVLRTLAQFAYLPNEKELLLSYSETGGKFFEVKRERKSLIDILIEFPSIQLPWLNFLELSPILNPRYYSVSSSSFQSNDLISIVTRRVNFNTPSGKAINGICSTYLTSLLPKKPNNLDFLDQQMDDKNREHLVNYAIQNSIENEKVFMYVKKSTFRLPENRELPIIMVAGGCGIAPFIGFLKDREYLLARGVSLGPAYLFFGCRSEIEMMFRDYILDCAERGVITGSYLAFSEAVPPVVVTDLLVQHGEILNPILDKAHIYMCGAAFANTAYSSFCNIIVKHSQIPLADAEKQMKDMILDGRYHEDLQ